MPDYIFLMHEDTTAPVVGADWPIWFARLRAAGQFDGGSAIGEGASFRKAGQAGPVAAHIGGFVRISAPDLEAARALLAGNPVYEAGGTVEVRILPVTD
jgi:hypothetical protein